MNRLQRLVLGLMIFGTGYCMGQAHVGDNIVTAQDGQTGIQEDTANKIREANRTLAEAMEALRADGMYDSVTDSPNSFLILSGGGNAREDLDSGRGVDPETFAALYAGQAVPEIQTLLGQDSEGRITYNNDVVRIYSKSRLQRVYANRKKLTETTF